MLVSADVYRPAAIKQLEQVAEQVKANFVPSSADQNPIDIAKRAIEQSQSTVSRYFDYRYRRSSCTSDEAMMDESKP